MSFLDKKLLVISHKLHIIDPLDSKKSLVKGGFGPIKNEFANHFKEIILCVPVKYKPLYSEYIYKDNIRIVPLPYYKNRKEMIRNLGKILKILAKEINKVDLIYNMGPNDMGIVGTLLSKWYRKPFFLSLDTDRAGKALTRDIKMHKKYFIYYFNKIVINKLIIILGRNHPAFVTGDMFLGENENWHQWIKSTYNSKEINQYKKNELSLLNKKNINIAFAGRLSEEKNIFTLIDACRLLKTKGYAIKLNIIGSGHLEQKLNLYKSKLEIEDVNFLGDVPNSKLMSTRFLSADIFVLPSLNERQGKVLLEAMSSSVPVVASNVGGIPSVIKDGENGLLFNPKSVEDLTEKIENLINDNCLRKRLVEGGYIFAKEHALDYEVEKILKEVEAVYKK